MPRVAVLINPRAGVRRHAPGVRAALARDVLRAQGVEGQVVMADGSGRGREAARALIAQGVETVVAWGGDGTINEVASQLVFRGVTLGIVPAGSGNGLARELGIDRDPRRALEAALAGPVRWIDAGELGGRLFFNVAGVGLDARLAAVFDAGGRRGLRGYVTSLLREVATYEPDRYRVAAGGAAIESDALLVALANTRQYGNRAVIAPRARVDDGLLELVVVPPLSPPAILWQARRLFTGTLHGLRGVRARSVREAAITASRPLTFHVDGEVAAGPRSLAVNVHARALPVRVPGRYGAGAPPAAPASAAAGRRMA